MKSNGERTVLFAVVGTSPAVVTETIWALAASSPPIVVDEVFIVTTTIGEGSLRRALLSKDAHYGGKTVWAALQMELDALAPDEVSFGSLSRFGSPRIEIVTNEERQELDDIQTSEDNEACADFILSHLKRYCSDPDVRVIGSLSGGRKTMGSLLQSCFSLVARKTDRLVHVLVNEPFDRKLEPQYYFPSREVDSHEIPGRDESIKNSAARIELSEIPFFTLRDTVMPSGDAEGFQELSAEFLTQMRKVSQPQCKRVPIYLQFSEADDRHLLHITARDSVSLSNKQCLFYLLLVTRSMKNESVIGTRTAFLELLKPQLEKWLHEGILTSSLRQAANELLLSRDEDDITKALSAGSKKMDKPPFVHYKDLLWVRKRQGDSISVKLLGYGKKPPSPSIWG